MREIDPKAFGRRVRARREELGLSQPALGRLTRYGQQNISHIEAGKPKRPEKLASVLSKALQCADIWLMSGEGPRPPVPKFFSTEIIVDIYQELNNLDKEEVSGFLAKKRKPRRKRAKKRKAA